MRSGIKILADTPGTGPEVQRQHVYLMKLRIRVGGTRTLRVSPHLAYGERGVPGTIPENAVLVMECTILEEREFPR